MGSIIATTSTMINQIVLAAVFMGIALTHTSDVVSDCQTTCKVTSRSNENDDGSWVVHFSNGISYFYLKQYNLLVVVNMHWRIISVIDGTNGIPWLLTPDNGFGGIQNMQTNVVYIIFGGDHAWDISGIANKDYSVIIEIIRTMPQYTAKVIGANINSTQEHYACGPILLRDFAITTDFTKWMSIRNQPEVIQQLTKYFGPYAEVLHHVLQGGKYTVEWGAVMYFITLTQMYELNDTLSLEFNEVIVSIFLTLKGTFSPELMSEYYNIIAMQSQQPTDVTNARFNNLTCAINGVGITYKSLQLALAAYRSYAVVKTHISTIRVNQSTSYISYNSMANGTWIFRITYVTSYVQVMSSYYKGYMAIFDPSLDYVIVFTTTNNFAFINRKTGNGLIIDGVTQLARYILATNDSIQKAFVTRRYSDVFCLVRDLAENTQISSNNSFNATQLLITLQNGDSVAQMLSGDDLERFKKDFTSMMDLLVDIDFSQGYGINNLVAVMMKGPRTSFIEDGFVTLVNKMYTLQLQGGEFYMVCATGIWNSIMEEWSKPLFQNIDQVLSMLKPGNNRGHLLKSLLEFTYIALRINPLSYSFIIDGSVD